MEYQPRLFFKAKLEPEKGVLHGAGQDPKAFYDYCKVMGEKQMPILYMTYVGIYGEKEKIITWGNDLRDQLALAAHGKAIPQIGVNMVSGKDTGEGKDHEVAGGLFDENIEVFCKMVKDLKRPAFIRIGYEFEGSWNGYQPETYKIAFKKITKALRNHNIDAATVWCSGGCSAEECTLEDVMTYYPGEDWVDWWGIDIFSQYELSDERVFAFCDQAIEHQKPVIIGESTARYVGVHGGKSSWQTWFAPYFKLIRDRPEIKAFCYINWEWAYWSESLGFKWHDWKDCRIEQNKYISQHFRQEMELPLYCHTHIS